MFELQVLTEIYGPPEWATALNPVRETYIFTHFDDDDNLEQSSSSGAGIPVGAILGIAFGMWVEVLGTEEC